MREILFKAKTWEGGRWVFGDLLQFQSNTVIHSYLNGCRVSDDVDPRTVCQYTGLNDSNGVKIFEGDFVNVRTTAYMFRSCVVKWNESNAMWSVASGAARYRMSDSFKYKVIGNIHDEEK